MTVELSHECLTELHDLIVAFTANREVRASLATTHGQCGQCVLEGLLETEELQDGKVH